MRAMYIAWAMYMAHVLRERHMHFAPCQAIHYEARRHEQQCAATAGNYASRHAGGRTAAPDGPVGQPPTRAGLPKGSFHFADLMATPTPHVTYHATPSVAW
jgi:hypothetical protein